MHSDQILLRIDLSSRGVISMRPQSGVGAVDHKSEIDDFMCAGLDPRRIGPHEENGALWQILGNPLNGLGSVLETRIRDPKTGTSHSK